MASTRNPRSASALLSGVRVGKQLDLDEHDPRETFGWDKEAAKAALPKDVNAPKTAA